MRSVTSTTHLEVAADAESDRSMADRVAELLRRPAPDTESFAAAVDALAAEAGETVYGELLHLLAHLRFAPAEARSHWRRILALQASMAESLGAPIDFRVALVRYFVDVDRRIESPKVMEVEAYRRTEASVYRDALTGLHNFRSLEEQLRRGLLLAARGGQPLSVVMIDVDDFKHYNDLNGHVAGNAVLCGVGRLLEDGLRESDLAARWGGEEFVLVLPDTSKADALQVAQRLRAHIAGHPFPHGDRQPAGRVTASLGVATFPGDAAEITGLLDAADAAMYEAKTSGKDRVAVAGDSLRSHGRAELEVAASYRELAHGYAPCRTVDVSEGGLCLVVDRPPEVGGLVEVRLELDPDAPPVRCDGIVVRVDEDRGAQPGVAIRIVHMSGQDRRRLSDHVARARTCQAA